MEVILWLTTKGAVAVFRVPVLDVPEGVTGSKFRIESFDGGEIAEVDKEESDSAGARIIYALVSVALFTKLLSQAKLFEDCVNVYALPEQVWNVVEGPP